MVIQKRKMWSSWGGLAPGEKLWSNFRSRFRRTAALSLRRTKSCLFWLNRRSWIVGVRSRYSPLKCGGPAMRRLILVILIGVALVLLQSVGLGQTKEEGLRLLGEGKRLKDKAGTAAESLAGAKKLQQARAVLKKHDPKEPQGPEAVARTHKRFATTMIQAGWAKATYMPIWCSYPTTIRLKFPNQLRVLSTLYRLL